MKFIVHLVLIKWWQLKVKANNHLLTIKKNKWYHLLIKNNITLIKKRSLENYLLKKLIIHKAKIKSN